MQKTIDIACVIDDDDVYHFTIKRLIKATKFAGKTLFFQDGLLALHFFKEYFEQPDELPDVIMLDINMPVLDGWQFMAEFVKIKPHLPKKIIVYMVTSSINDEDIFKANKIAEISDYIVKPVSENTMMHILEDYSRRV